MSSSLYRSQLARKNKMRSDAEKKIGELRGKEARKRSAAAKARTAAAKSKSDSTIRSKSREADRYEAEANSAARDAAAWQAKAAGFVKDTADLQVKVAKAEQADREVEDRKRQRERLQADRRAKAERTQIEGRLSATQRQVDVVLRALPAPKPEKLRVLMLAASAEGDLRVSREQARIRLAVERATHRDQVELDVRPSATGADLLDGITKFRPHVVHFSGHSDEDLIVLERDVDEPHEGVVVTAKAFARAVAATDEPPLLVLLNSCNSAGQIDHLVETVAPFAIGMSDTIGDLDAIAYAAQFYAAVTNGQSIASAHASGQAAVELAGLPDHELPTLAHAPDVDPRATFLVKPPQ